jgi:hypothetical protein
MTENEKQEVAEKLKALAIEHKLDVITIRHPTPVVPLEDQGKYGALHQVEFEPDSLPPIMLMPSLCFPDKWQAVILKDRSTQPNGCRSITHYEEPSS